MGGRLVDTREPIQALNQRMKLVWLKTILGEVVL